MVDQRLDRLANHGGDVGGGVVEPPALGAVGNLEDAKLADEPDDGGGDGRGQHESGNPPEGALGYGDEGLIGLSGATLADGFQGADVAGDEGEDGHADAALDEHTEEGVLHDPRGEIRGGGGSEEVLIEGTGYVGRDDEEGREATEALWDD